MASVMTKTQFLADVRARDPNIGVARGTLGARAPQGGEKMGGGQIYREKL